MDCSYAAWNDSCRRPPCIRSLLSTASFQSIKPRRITTYYPAFFTFGHTSEGFFDILARMRPGGVSMRVIGGPHQVVHTDQIAQPDTGFVFNEGSVDLAMEIVTGRHRQFQPRPEAMALIDAVGALEEIRYPADVAFHRDDCELGKQFADPAEQQPRQRFHVADGVDQDLTRHQAAHILLGMEHLAPGIADRKMEMDGQCKILSGCPQRIEHLAAERPRLGEARNQQSTHAQLRDALGFTDARFDIVCGNESDSDQAARI